MPDIALDFSHQHPDVNELVANGVKAILFYSRVSTPPRHYIESVVAAGIGALPIFETDATRSFLGFNAGRDDAAAAEGDLRRIGVPEGVRLYVNMADTPNVKGNEDLIRDYANGFAQSFPANMAPRRVRTTRCTARRAARIPAFRCALGRRDVAPTRFREPEEQLRPLGERAGRRVGADGECRTPDRGHGCELDRDARTWRVGRRRRHGHL